MMENVATFSISFEGKKMLYSKGRRRATRKWYIASAVPPARGDSPAAGKPETPLNLARMEVLIDPRGAWKREYNEVWRLERDSFYDPPLHRLNLQAPRQRDA